MRSEEARTTRHQYASFKMHVSIPLQDLLSQQFRPSSLERGAARIEKSCSRGRLDEGDFTTNQRAPALRRKKLRGVVLIAKPALLGDGPTAFVDAVGS